MNIVDSFREFIVKSKAESSEAKFSLGIATTASSFNEPFFSFPREIQGWGYYLHVLCPSSSHGIQIIKSLQTEIDSFFLDAENKTPKFRASEIEVNSPDIEFCYLYPNATTIQSCFDFLKSDMEARVFIFGHGDLAFNFAALLKKRGFKFSWRASRESLSPKYKAMKDEFGAEERELIDSQDGFFYNFSPFKADFFTDLESHSQIKIIDVAGKGAFGDAFGSQVAVLDVSARLVNEISYILIGNKYSKNYGRKTSETGVSFVSGGYPGNAGDLVVDCYLAPSFLIGISNGKGGFSQRINKPLNHNETPQA